MKASNHAQLRPDRLRGAGKPVREWPEDLRPGEFLTGGEAWAALGNGDLDAALFGVDGTGAEYDDLLDAIAAACAADGPSAVADLHALETSCGCLPSWSADVGPPRAGHCGSGPGRVSGGP